MAEFKYLCLLLSLLFLTDPIEGRVLIYPGDVFGAFDKQKSGTRIMRRRRRLFTVRRSDAGNQFLVKVAFLHVSTL